MGTHTVPISLQPEPYPETDPIIDGLVHEILGRIADRWTMLLLDVSPRMEPSASHVLR